MTWEETIKMIRLKPEHHNLVRYAYYDENLPENVVNFRSDGEYLETLRLIKEYLPNGRSLADIGAGNGIASASFAMDNYQVTAIEPDPSKTVGTGAIQYLKEYYKLKNLQVVEGFAESIPLPDQSVDIVYVRQAVHHATDLHQFLGECSRIIRKGGLFISIRDHVVYDEKDKVWFLQSHPLHQYYQGENAFTLKEYQDAITRAGLRIQKTLKHFDSIINYFPARPEDLQAEKVKFDNETQSALRTKIGLLANNKLLLTLYKLYVTTRYGSFQDERNIPGRLYSFIALKN